MMCVLRKYFSLWISIRKVSVVMLMLSEMDSLVMVIVVLEIRLLIIGSRFIRKVIMISVLVNGMWMLNSGSVLSRKIVVNMVLISEILICVKMML